MKNNKKQKGFTLIELLVVIAIIAILAVVVILTLNPAQLLAQARDSNRISDFATMKSALTLYATDVSTSTPMYGTTTASLNVIYTANSGVTSTAIATYTTTSTSSSTPQTTWGFSTSTNSYVSPYVETNTSRSVSGSGWIPVNLNAISSGAPISAWPVDPTNSGNYMYMYAASTTVFKLVAHMESSKYITGGPNDVESTDGGPNPGAYEGGTNLFL